MRAPAFWWRRPPGLAALLLRPAAALYGAVAAGRLSAFGAEPVLPVICVGNFSVGGSGKTPTAVAIAMLLRATGIRPGFLLRGYGGRLRGPVLADSGTHSPDAVGDEALLLARHAPTAVAGDRPTGAALLAAQGLADIIIMDDGLQNPSLRKDLRLAVFDAATGLGNGLVLPAGPLRAPSAAQWPLVEAAIVVGEGAPGEAIAREAERRGVPVLRASLRPDPDAAARVRGRQVLAFAGIGRPEKFAETLRLCGAEVVQLRPFPDHHPFSFREARALLAEADRDGLLPVTTEKDWVRLERLAAALPALGTVTVLPVTLRFDDPEAVIRLLAGAARINPLANPAAWAAAARAG